MLSRRGREACLGICENVETAFDFIGGMAAVKFEQDRRTIYAVTRCLEIISEATRRFDTAMKDRHPHIPSQQVSSAGNIYRHEYANVSPLQIWRTVQERLRELLAMCVAELQRADAPGTSG
ncbi:DUF86 domain-containing protein [Methylobacterium sp. WL30]|nr:HepT-like ribonuclease domain-containing protein [Methylobacterium sp. WL30]TXN41337.1 DUF86 domain-containing protein [Methylobacterium sp. WL93]TXN51742.1 DUF86 domain-containing protein [Methylobacterium sp. WL119]TXN70229.1 DUF86 domain-containing protein [Methylobacterium sp. WL30]